MGIRMTRLAVLAALVFCCSMMSTGGSTAAPACASCPADACPAGGFEDVLDQVCALAPGQLCASRCGCCRDEQLEPFAGVTFGPPAPTGETWPGLGGKGELAAKTELCLLRDLGTFPGGLAVAPAGISLGPLGDVTMEQTIGYTSFDPVGRTMSGYHAVSLCVPPFGCISDQTQAFTATLLSAPAPAGSNCGPYPFADAYGLQVTSSDTERRLDLDLPSVEVFTPYGTVSGTPRFHYETALKSGAPAENTIAREDKGCVALHSTLVPLFDRPGGAAAVDFMCAVLPLPVPEPGFGALGQIALGGRSADPSVPVSPAGTPRPDLDLAIARNADEKTPAGNVGASIDFIYDIAGLIPAKFRTSPFSLKSEVFVKPAIDTRFASQFQVHGSDATFQYESPVPPDCSIPPFHRALVDLRGRAESFVSFRIDAGFDLVLKLKHDFGFPIGTISVKVIDEHPKFDVVPEIKDLTSKDSPAAGALFDVGPQPAFQSLTRFSAPTGVADPQAFLNECFAAAPPAPQTPPTGGFAPGDPSKFTKVLEFPCNLCLQWGGGKVCGPKNDTQGSDYECSFENGGCTDPSGQDFCTLHDAPPELLPSGSDVLFPVGQSDPAKQWLCDTPAKAGCMDLCTYDPTAPQPLTVVRSAAELDPGKCGGGPVIGLPCGSDAQCDDANPCTLDDCDFQGEFGRCTQVAQAGSCDDGLHCNGADQCALGACSLHAGNPCAAQAPCCSESAAACVGLDQCPIPDPRCGNGFLQPGEGCDDGNAAGGDGCSAACLLECGNHVIDPGETCDDGNTEDGDGCSAVCRLEKEPPDCSGAYAATSQLWPPNHAFVNVAIGGVTDPAGAPVAITITGVRQDEPLDGLGDGDTCPDAAGLGTSAARLRAERAGTPKAPGDGRIYHIAFVADDGAGGQCAGEVVVCVPHDQRPGHACVDQGPLVDSAGICAAP